MADLIYCCKTRVKMLVFDRPTFFPLILAFCSSIHYIKPPLSILIHVHKCLECLGVSRAECARHSPCFAAFRSGSSGPGARCLLLHRDPRGPGPGVVRRFPGRRPAPFDRRCLFCASLLKAYLCFSCLYSDTLLPLTLVCF